MTAVGTSAVVEALNHIIAIAAVIAFTSAVLCLVLIRQRDFVTPGAPRRRQPSLDAAGCQSTVDA